MSDQLQLDIRERLAYSADNFIEHAGVRDAIQAVRSSVGSPSFQILFIQGAKRTGKTHMAIACSQLCASLGHFPRLFDGRQFSERVAAETASEPSVLIIDDADFYLNAVHPGGSGEFVSCIEAHRVLGSKIILFSTASAESLPCDQHVMSRILPGTGPQLTAPDSDEVASLLRVMARQRGMQLTERKVEYVTRRIGRDVAAIEDYLDRLYQLSRTLGKSARFPTLYDAL